MGIIIKRNRALRVYPARFRRAPLGFYFYGCVVLGVVNVALISIPLILKVL